MRLLVSSTLVTRRKEGSTHAFCFANVWSILITKINDISMCVFFYYDKFCIKKLYWKESIKQCNTC